MNGRECIVCAARVESEGDISDLAAGGSFTFEFCNGEPPSDLWIHFLCLQRVAAAAG